MDVIHGQNRPGTLVALLAYLGSIMNNATYFVGMYITSSSSKSST